MLNFGPVPFVGLLLLQSANMAVDGAAQQAAPPRVYVTYATSPATRDQWALAKEMVRVLEREQPRNLGRKKTFPKMQLRGLTPENRGVYLLKQTGWGLVIKKADRIEGGWRATVAVHLVANTEDGWPIQVLNKHYEVYVYHDGKLKLERDYLDPELRWRPDYKLSDGLLPAFPLPFPLAERKKLFGADLLYSVGVWWEGEPVGANQQPGRQVQKVLKREKPQNPGRLKSFPKLEADVPARAGQPPQHHTFKIVGWGISIRRAEHIPGGWRATVRAIPNLMDERTGQVVRYVHNFHTEVYVYEDGKLRLESESPDPKRDQGLSIWLR